MLEKVAGIKQGEKSREHFERAALLNAHVTWRWSQLKSLEKHWGDPSMLQNNGNQREGWFKKKKKKKSNNLLPTCMVSALHLDKKEPVVAKQGLTVAACLVLC